VTAYAMIIIIPVLCLTFLLYTRMEKGRAIRRKELEHARTAAAQAIRGLQQVQKEIGTQVTAGYTDLGVLAVLVQDHLDVAEDNMRKELTR
jgi:hypothetical protein